MPETAVMADPPENWSEPERWARKEILAGRIADFNRRERREWALDPTTPDGWDDRRLISQAFLKAILFRKPHTEEVPFEGVRIVGAWFTEPIDLAFGRTSHQLWLDRCRFQEPVDMSSLGVSALSLEGSTFAARAVQPATLRLDNAHVGGQLNLTGTTVAGKLVMNGLRVEQALSMQGPGASFQDVDLTVAHVGGQLDLTGARVAGKLGMNDLRVEQNLFMREPYTSFQNVDLTNACVGGQLDLTGANVGGKMDINGAHVSGQISLIGANVSGKLSMYGLKVDQGLLMRGPDARFQDVDLTTAHVAGLLDLSGATVASKLDMVRLTVDQDLRMGGAGARFLHINLSGAHVRGQLSLTGATVAGKLNMVRLTVDQDLHMEGPDARFRDIDLGGAHVGGQLSLTDATVRGELHMNGLKVDQSLHMAGPDASFQGVDLTTAHVAGQLVLTRAKVAGKLGMNSLEVGQSLHMHGPDARFQDVDLAAAKVGAELVLVGAKVAGQLSMERVEIGRGVLAQRTEMTRPVVMVSARVGADLDLSGSVLGRLDLSGARIAGELRLGSSLLPRAEWQGGARPSLDLHNAHAGALQDRRDRMSPSPQSLAHLLARDVQETEHCRGRMAKLATMLVRRHLAQLRRRSLDRWVDAWPAELRLDGFTYDRLGGFGGTAASTIDSDVDVDMPARPMRWYVEWLARDRSYSPQPYEQLAKVFREAGEPAKADQILYASRERARRQAPWWRALGLLVLKWTIGYGLGHRYFRALIWVTLFTAIGTGLLWSSTLAAQGPSPMAQGPQSWPEMALYSLDQLLPFVEFKEYKDFEPASPAVYWFYLESVLGWALGSFLVAGLAGLTQR